jgi:hypothetical protein
MNLIKLLCEEGDKTWDIRVSKAMQKISVNVRACPTFWANNILHCFSLPHSLPLAMLCVMPWALSALTDTLYSHNFMKNSGCGLPTDYVRFVYYNIT